MYNYSDDTADELRKRRDMLYAALAELIRCEDEAAYHSVAHLDALAAARRVLKEVKS